MSKKGSNRSYIQIVVEQIKIISQVVSKNALVSLLSIHEGKISDCVDSPADARDITRGILSRRSLSVKENVTLRVRGRRRLC